MDSTKSSTRLAHIGAPQGSILGPLLGLIYLNDLQYCSILKKILSADDSTVYLSENNPHELIRKLNIQLAVVSDWFVSNRLTLHPKKTRFIFFSPPKCFIKDDPKIYIDGIMVKRIGELSKERSFKYVGVKIDENLNFKEHVAHVHKK